MRGGGFIAAGGGGGGAAGTQTLGMSNLGNTSGTTGVVTGSAIQYLFAGGNNITLSQSLNGVSGTLTVIGGAGAAAGTNTLGMSDLGNTSGTTGVVTGTGVQYVFAGGNNITLSQSINGVSGTLTISAFNQTAPVVSNAIQSVGTATGSGTNTSRFAADDHVHAGVPVAGISGGNTSGETGARYGSILFAGGNNITLSGATAAGGQTITISAPTPAAQSNQSAIKAFGATNTGNTAGDTGVSTGIDWVIAGTNNVTVSESTVAGGPNTLWLSAPAPGGGDAIRGIAAGASTATTNTVNFSNANNVSFAFGAAGNSTVITASASYSNPVVSNAIQDVGTATNAGTNTSRFAADDHVHRGVVGIVGVGTASTFYGSVHLSAGNNVTLSTAGASNAGSIAIHVAAPGGAATYSNVFQPFDWYENTGTTTGSLSQLHVQPFSLPVNLSFGQINFIGSASVAATAPGNNTFGVRLTNSTQALIYSQVHTIGNSNIVDLFLFTRGSGVFSSELQTIQSTRNTFATHYFLTFSARGTLTNTAGGNISISQQLSVGIIYPMLTSSTATSVNPASSYTDWKMGYSTWATTVSNSASQTMSTSASRTTSVASTYPGTTAWSSFKMIPLNFATSLTPGEYWLGMLRHSSVSNSSTSASTITGAAGTGASYSVTYSGTNMTQTGMVTWGGATHSVVSSLGWLGMASQASMAADLGLGSFSGTWASDTTYLNNLGNPAGAVAFSQLRTNVSFFRSWFQMGSNRV